MKSFRIYVLAGLFVLLIPFPALAQEDLFNHYYAGKYDQVIAATSVTIAAGDTSFSSYYLKALSESQLGRTEDAIATLQKVQEIFPDDSRIIRMLASQFYEAGDYVKARNHYSELVRTDSTDVASWLKLAEISSFRQQYEQSIAALEQVLIIDSLNLNSLMMMGNILNRHNNSGAVVYYVRAYEIYPDNQKVAYALGNWYIQAREPWNTVLICEQILESDPLSIKFLKLQGYAYYKMGDPGPAISHFQKAIALGDSSTFTFKFMGISQYLAIEFEEAIASLQKGIEKDSADAEIQFFLGASLANTTRKEEAMDHLDRSLELMKPDPAVISRIYSEQGNIMRLETDYKRAYELYEKSWEADTTNPMSLYFMASILDNSLHLSKKALVDYQRFINLLDLLPEVENKNQQIPTIRAIVEDRIELLREELFFLDEDR